MIRGGISVIASVLILAASNLSTVEAILVIGGLLIGLLIVLFGTRSRQTKADLVASVAALQGEDTVNKNEIARLKERDSEKDRTIDALQGTVNTLERIVTGVDVIIEGFCLLVPEGERQSMRRRLESVRRDSEGAVSSRQRGHR